MPHYFVINSLMDCRGDGRPLLSPEVRCVAQGVGNPTVFEFTSQ